MILPTDAPTSQMRSEDESMESRLLEVTAEVLGFQRDRIHVSDSFVELGGNEQIALKLRNRCKDAGIEVKPEDILRCQTLAELQTCLTPCPRQPTSVNFHEPITVAPLAIHKTSRFSPEDEEQRSWPRHSTNSSVSSNKKPETELEKVLSRHSLVSSVATTTPKAGLLEGKSVVFLTLASIEPLPYDTFQMHLVPSSQMLIAGTQITTLRRFAAASLDGVPVPGVWIALNEMPLTESGDIDRRRLRTWAQNINEETYRRVMRLDTHEVLEAPSTDMERSLQRVVSKVLQVPQDHVGINFTFSQLGGDEITAMELVARCKHESIYLSAEEAMKDLTLADLALTASQRGGLAHKWDEDDSASFDLSPMQQLYFLTAMGGDVRRRILNKAGYRFNQSHLLRVMRPCMVDDIHAGIEAVVGHHPMLRSRFMNQDGEWSQRISPNVSGSYAFNHHSVSSDDEVKAVIEHSQAAINIQNGPVFGVDYFQTHDGQQMIYLVAHHLAVDTRSWRTIIRDLDELLDSGSLLSQRSMSFHRWIEHQKLVVLQCETTIPPLPAAHSNPAYWGLKGVSNSYEDAIETNFSLNPEITSMLQDTCNLAFQTEPVDIYLAGLLLSFSQTFTDRPVPVVWNQEPGRDSWSPEIDISETVGWFTCLSPLIQLVSGADNFVDVLRKVKDGRRMPPVTGSRFFASKFYNPECDDIFSLDEPFEVVFSYSESFQQLQHANGILEQIPIPGRTLASRTSDIGPTVGRIAAFEVNIMVEEGSAKIKFVYNRYSKHQERISTWISNYEHVLLEAIGRMSYHAQELTLSDVPYLDTTYDGLNKLNKYCADTLKLTTVREVEAVYPVTANQQHILVNQSQRPGSNILRSIIEIVAPTGEPIDTSRLCVAWQLVTARHAALRTVFLESVTQTGLFDQMVLHKVSPDMLFIDSVPPDDPVDEFSTLPNIGAMEAKPAHRLTVCKTPTKTLVCLDISAALCDTMSVNIILRDLWQTYSTQRAIPGSGHFSYPDYIEMLKSTRQGRSLAYWTDLLSTTRPCLFPMLTSRIVDGHLSHAHAVLDVPSHDISAFSRSQGISEEAVIRLAWAVVLRSFTGVGDTLFGCSTSGRERFVNGLSDAVGCFGNTVPCAVSLRPGASVVLALHIVDEHVKASLLHQFVSIPEILHALGLKGGAQLFNTFLSYSEELPDLNSRFTTRADLELKPVSQQHATSFDLSLHVHHLSGNLVLDASSSIIPEEQVVNVANAFGVAVQSILSSPNSLVRDISLVSDRDHARIIAWSNEQISDELLRDVTVVHELVTQQALQSPHSPAVCAWDGDLSYQQMLDAATKLAHYLVDIGVGPHAAVPVVLDKSRWTPVALLAVLKTGAAFVPIDAQELTSIQSIFEQLDAKLAITTGQTASILGNLFEKVVVINDSLFLQMGEYCESLPSIATPDDTACILFTPTSTKDARGVAFSHKALSITFMAQGPAVRITAKSRVMQLSSFNSDIALSEVFTTLVHGGCVCIQSAIERLRNYAEDVRHMRVNWSYMTPFLSRKLDPSQLPTLKVVCFRTRSLDDDTYGAWAGRANVVLAYGAPDVCPLGISFLSVVSPSDLKSIGQPFAGNFWIVNPENHRKLMPVGAVGELVIEGPTLGSTYPRQQTDNTLSEELEVHAGTKTKYFKTGHHRVRYLEGGVMQFVSSKREDLKINGCTVNLTEIERHIRRCLGQGVDVMVEAIAFRGAKDVPVLAAFVELGERLFDARADLNRVSPAIKETVCMVKQLVESGLKNIVAPHLIPSIFIPVKYLPMALSLKVDRRALKHLIHGLSREQLEALSTTPNPVQTIGLKPLPLTQTEEAVRVIVARVVGIEPAMIGPTDGFFDVGGDEVLAAKLVVACRHEGVTVSIADILRNATLTELCRSMTTTDDSTLPEPYSPAEAVSRSPPPQTGSTTETLIEKVIAPRLGVERKAIKEVADTSAMQTRYIEAGMLRGRANIDYFTFAFAGGINGNRLEEACQMLGTIHPILRTAFTPHNRRVYQAVLKSFTVEFEHHSCPSWKLVSTTRKLIAKDQAAPIAFNKPMTKFLFVDSGKQSTLVLRLSKAQYDDLSIALLVKDLKRLYDSTENPPRRPSYCEFVKSIKGNNLEASQQYWQGLLEGATMTRVVDHTKPYHLTTHAKTLRQKLLVGSRSNLGISFETVLKSAWAMVLASLSSTPDVVFGEIIDGRHVRLQSGQSVASVMGPTTNTIPVRIQFPDNPLSPLELLQYVHGQRIAGIPYESMGFLDIVERCTSWPYWTRFSTVVQHQHEETTIIPGEPKALHLGSTPCLFDVLESKAQDVYDFFVHSIMRGQGKLELGLTFCTDRIPEDLAEQALRLLCETVNMLTSVSIMQPIIPSAHQYRAMQKKIPMQPKPTAAPLPEVEEANLSSLIPQEPARAIQTAINKAWANTLNPRSLGVPEEHIHRAAFYDLWGSLVPAAQLAAQLNRALPKLGLPGLDSAGPIVSMEDIIDNPTMLKQFELIAAKMAAGLAAHQHQQQQKEHEQLPASTTETTTSATHRHTRKKSSISMSGSAATVAKSLRRIASTVTRSSTTPTPVPATTANAVVVVGPIDTSLPAGTRLADISPLTPALAPAPQLPKLPDFSPVSPHVFPLPVEGVAVVVPPPANGSPNISSAESMTTGSSCADSRHSDEEGEHGDVLGPLRSEVAGRVRLQTQGLGLLRSEGTAGEEFVSPLSAASGRGVRFWEGEGEGGKGKRKGVMGMIGLGHGS